MDPNKIDPALRTRMRSVESDDGLPVIIRHKGDMFFSQAMGDVRDFNLLQATSLALRNTDISSLSESDEIEYIWADWPVTTWLDVSVPKISVPPVWLSGYEGKGVKLAIIDTGIDPNHEDFANRIIARKTFIPDAKNDDNGHGTHVAGIAAGSGAKSNGKYRGVAPEAHLYIAKVLDKLGNGSMSLVMAGIEWAVAQGVDVINLSLGSAGPNDGSDALSAMCDAAVQEKGIVICAAAGNTGPRSSTVGSPGSARYVITVGAVNDNDEITDFSSRGPTEDGRIKPEIVLPGFGIVAPQATGTEAGAVIAPGYISLNGTSMATPHLSGAVCLLLEAKHDLTPDEIKKTLQETALDLGQPANAQGLGRANIYDAFKILTKQSPTTQPPTPPPATPPANKGCLPNSLAKLLGQ